jgi:hypothetical protein
MVDVMVSLNHTNTIVVLIYGPIVGYEHYDFQIIIQFLVKIFWLCMLWLVMTIYLTLVYNVLIVI